MLCEGWGLDSVGSALVLRPCRYAELRGLALARHAIVPPAFRIQDDALAQSVAAGARIAAVLSTTIEASRVPKPYPKPRPQPPP